MIGKRKFDELNAQQKSGGNLSPGFKGRTRSPSPVGVTIREHCKKRRKINQQKIMNRTILILVNS